jgi:TolB-like protein
MLLLRLTSRSGQEYCVKSALARETGVKNHAPGRLSSLRRAIAQQSARPSRYPVPDVPSIAVLPFQSMSADGMVEDIITGLSRILRLFVIARNSRLTYKGQAVDVKRVGRELGVCYVLWSSAQVGQAGRTTTQLIDAETGVKRKRLENLDACDLVLRAPPPAQQA